MDPNSQNPQEVNNAPVQNSVTQPVVQQVAPLASTPPPTPPVPPVAPTPPVSNDQQPTKKNSPILIIALTVLLLAIFSFGGYILWTRSLGVSKNEPVSTKTPEATPITTPFESPNASNSAAPSIESSATPSASTNPASSSATTQ